MHVFGDCPALSKTGFVHIRYLLHEIKVISVSTIYVCLTLMLHGIIMIDNYHSNSYGGLFL